MKRNKLLLKKADKFSTTRKANTPNPLLLYILLYYYYIYIIYNFLDQLEKVFQEYPELDENKIYNCDESGFPTDQRGRIVSVKGQPALKLSFGPRCENITVLGYVALVALHVIHLYLSRAKVL